jgi:hypothetical protein
MAVVLKGYPYPYARGAASKSRILGAAAGGHGSYLAHVNFPAYAASSVVLGLAGRALSVIVKVGRYPRILTVLVPGGG